MSNIVQYVVVRSDLRSALNWPLGAIIAQCCHATAAVMHLNAEDAETVAYLKDLDNMHKVVLQAKDEAALVKLGEKLKENEIKHKLWIEQPENIPTCIALKPYVKESVHKYVKHLKLLKE
ncbi:GL27294 [Drosophila persimilis]|uniref:peptidyl-tRNA hydrolase n=2 Tax=pseudoobscura subgroup TaxID=32358 RepID=A0A6I8UN13_DROPS|nr:putative peptidyl-tRNA hydrolase PTRHD1 [Drosophila pseudoobscura]XP_002023848.1 putative peptidyl-tRNA hydrolase PTRHD1 [Drosophila persimilis]EDW28051.1 GL27294 [Drosophila persimilis]